MRGVGCSPVSPPLVALIVSRLFVARVMGSTSQWIGAVGLYAWADMRAVFPDCAGVHSISLPESGSNHGRSDGWNLREIRQQGCVLFLPWRDIVDGSRLVAWAPSHQHG